MKHLLLTGFEPFGGSDINPSAEVVKALDGKKIGNTTVHGFIIPLVYNEIQKCITDLIDKIKPDYIILMGQAPRPSISFERVAINIADAQHVAYNCGTKPDEESLVENGPVGYFTTMNIKKFVNNLAEKGIPSFISNSAGTFGCNQIFYHCLQYLHHQNMQNIPCDFIHLPALPEQTIKTPTLASMSLEMMIYAMIEVIASLED